MEDWSLPATTITVNVSGHDAATLGGLPGSFYLNASNLLGVLNSSVLPSVGTEGTYTKITTDAYGRAINGTTLSDIDIPALPASKTINTAVTLSDTQTITGQKTLTGGVIINDTIVESSISATELFTSWQVATGWIISGAEVSHTTGVDSITGNLASNLVLYGVYRIALNITNRTVGSITLSFAGNSIPTIATTSTLDLPVSTIGNTFSFLPTTDFNGTVSLSVRLINPSSSLVSGINGIKGRFSSTFLGLGTSLYHIQSLNNGCSFMGVNAGRSNTTGGNNSFMGVNAGRSNTTGGNNSFMGANAGRLNTTGYSNSFMGMSAGYANTTGAGCIAIGFESGYNSTTESNALFIANNRNFNFLKGDDINLASTAVLRVNGTVASTSTTTGALVVSGGVGCQDLYATSLNGQLRLKTYTTAARPVASASTVGQIWLNTTTGKIEYVATSSTIQVITSA